MLLIVFDFSISSKMINPRQNFLQNISPKNSVQLSYWARDRSLRFPTINKFRNRVISGEKDRLLLGGGSFECATCCSCYSRVCSFHASVHRLSAVRLPILYLSSWHRERGNLARPSRTSFPSKSFIVPRPLFTLWKSDRIVVRKDSPFEKIQKREKERKKREKRKKIKMPG